MMKETIYQYAYRAFIGMLVISISLFLLAEGVVPFNMQASWTEGQVGASLVLTMPNAHVRVGEQVAYSTALRGQVLVSDVTQLMRNDGELRYEVAGIPTDISAREVVGSVVATVPFAGVWVRALYHPVGVMAFLGVPLTMLVLDILLSLQGALGRMRRMYVLHTVQEEEVGQYEAEDRYKNDIRIRVPHRDDREQQKIDMTPVRGGIFSRLSTFFVSSRRFSST